MTVGARIKAGRAAMRLAPDARSHSLISARCLVVRSGLEPAGRKRSEMVEASAKADLR